MLTTLRVTTLSLLFALPLFLEAEIVETITIADAIPYIDNDTWFLVDLDNTTFEGKQALGHTEWFYDKAYKLMAEGMTLEDATRECYPEWIEVQKACAVKPVEAAFAPAIIGLQQKGIVVMGLTHRQPSIADSTDRQINSLGFNFVPTAPFSKTFSVPSPTPTLYENGVLYTGEYNKKGVIFIDFLSLLGKKPKKVVFIDDKRKHVEEVESALTSIGIEYIGIHYRAIENAERVYFPEIAEFQLKALKQIMSNEAASLLMDAGLE